MKHLTDALRKSVEAENWYGALTIALTLPDICRRAEDPKITSKPGYISWFDKWLKHKYTHQIGPDRETVVFLTGADLYALRCAFLHQGEFSTTDQNARDALHGFTFAVPPHGMIIHNNQITQGGVVTLQLQVSEFCNEVADAVDAWEKWAETQDDIKKRIDALGKIVLPAADGSFKI